MIAKCRFSSVLLKKIKGRCQWFVGPVFAVKKWNPRTIDERTGSETKRQKKKHLYLLAGSDVMAWSVVLGAEKMFLFLPNGECRFCWPTFCNTWALNTN